MDEKSPSIEKWRGRVAKRTFRSYLTHFKGFMAWLGENDGAFSKMSPDELIAWQKKSDNGNEFDILDLIQTYINTREGWRHNSMKTAYGAIRSFFTHNRCKLPSDESFNIRSDVPPVVAKLTIENVRDMIAGSNRCYKAIFTSMFQAGMDIAGFLYWNENGYNSLMEQLDKNPKVVMINQPGRKKYRNKKPYRTYIAKDAIDMIRNYLPTRPTTDSEGKPTMAIFYNRLAQPITENALRFYWLRHLDRIGLIDRSQPKIPKDTPPEERERIISDRKKTRYGFNPHEMRDIFASQWTLSGTLPMAREFQMGHFDKLGYDKSHRNEAWTRSEYVKASRMLQIITSPEPFGLADTDELQTLRERVAQLEADRDITQIIQEDRDGPVTQEQIQYRRQVEQLDARLPTTEEGWNRFFAELKKIEARQKEESQ